MAVAYLGGVDIFGPQVSIEHVPKAGAAQISAFFGVSGTLSQWGGGRGRAFMVRGVCRAVNFLGLRAFEAIWDGYKDGQARTLVDPYGYSWANVIFDGDFQFTGKHGWTGDGDVTREYKAVLRGLT